MQFLGLILLAGLATTFVNAAIIEDHESTKNDHNSSQQIDDSDVNPFGVDPPSREPQQRNKVGGSRNYFTNLIGQNGWSSSSRAQNIEGSSNSDSYQHNSDPTNHQTDSIAVQEAPKKSKSSFLLGSTSFFGTKKKHGTARVEDPAESSPILETSNLDSSYKSRDSQAVDEKEPDSDQYNHSSNQQIENLHSPLPSAPQEPPKKSKPLFSSSSNLFGLKKSKKPAEASVSYPTIDSADVEKSRDSQSAVSDDEQLHDWTLMETPRNAADIGDNTLLYHPNDATLYYWLPSTIGVQLVTIENGITSEPTPPSSLSIYELTESRKRAMSAQGHQAVPAAILHIDAWAYPLVPNQTAILKNDQGMYVMPCPVEDRPNLFVGILLPHKMDEDGTLEQQFKKTLKKFAILKGIKLSETIARTVEDTAKDYVAPAIHTAVGWVGDKLVKRAEAHRATIQPTDKPAKVNRSTKYAGRAMNYGGKLLYKGTSLVVENVGKAGVYVGRGLAKEIGKSNSETLKNTTTVLAGGITAVFTVWIALEEASKALAKRMSDETVKTVEVSYGHQAAKTTRDMLKGIGGLTLASYKITGLAPRAIAGSMARKVGLQVVKEMDKANKKKMLQNQNGGKMPMPPSMTEEEQKARLDEANFGPTFGRLMGKEKSVVQA